MLQWSADGRKEEKKEVSDCCITTAHLLIWLHDVRGGVKRKEAQKKRVKDLSSVLMELTDEKANPDKERARGRRKAAQQVSGGKLR